MADQTTWLGWDLPDVGGNRSTWGDILRARWQDIDDLFAGVEVPNSKHIGFGSSTDIGMVVSSEHNVSDRARFIFGDSVSSPDADARFIYDFVGNTTNILQLQSVVSGSIEKTFWEAQPQVFQFLSRLDLVPDTPTALYACPARDSGDLVAIKFGEQRPTQDSDIATMQRFTIAYDVSDQRLYIQTHDSNGDFVANAIIIEANGDVIIGSLNP